MKNDPQLQNYLTPFLAVTLSPLLATGKINALNGSYSETWIDLPFNSDFSLHRTFNSRSLNDGIFGYGWCSNLETRLQEADGQFLLESCGKTDPAKVLTNSPRHLASAPESRTLNVVARGVKYEFSTTGRLLRLQKQGGELKFNYDKKGRIRSIKSGRRLFRFRYNLYGKVDQIQRRGRVLANYGYKRDNLVSVKNAWRNQYLFEYDAYHNLTAVSYPDGSEKKMNYNSELDTITSFKGRNGCRTQIDYPEKNKEYFMTRIRKYCKEELVGDSVFEFWYKKNPNDRDALFRTRKNTNGFVFDAYYHTVTGQLMKLESPTTSSEFFFNQDGRLALIKNQRSSIQYKYSSGRIVGATKHSHQQKTRQIFSYLYDSRGLINQVQESEKSPINIQYDKQHQVEKISFSSENGRPVALIDRPQSLLHRPIRKAEQELLDHFLSGIEPIKRWSKTTLCLSEQSWIYQTPSKRCIQ